MTETLKIDRLGHRGDGVSDGPDGPIYVPLTLPDELVEIKRTGDRGRLASVVSASPVRVAAACPHFGKCGGCSLQHVRQAEYLDWKREQVALSLARRGLNVEVEPVVPIARRTRRRTILAARRNGADVMLGYHERLSSHIVPVSACPVLAPEIEDALPALANWLGPLVPSKGECRIGVTAAKNGLDIALEVSRLPSSTTLTHVISGCPPALGIARLSIAGEPVLVHADPLIEVDGMDVRLPPGGFLQAAQPAEEAMAKLVLNGVGQAKRVCDLFAGFGTFSLRLARNARVLAVEGESEALAALADAARRAAGLKPIETLRRNLELHPLSPKELERFDAAVFDPPRSGAKAQAEELARSKVGRLVAVSCNPATLARDLRTLVDGGYVVKRVVPVDQFLFSHHIEVVALLERH